MKVTIKWLEEFVDFELSPEKLADILTMAGFEVEAIDRMSGDVDSLKVAKILEVKTHPASDKLKICAIDTGSHKCEVVCGAPNAAPGLLSIYAPPNTVLPTGLKIEKSAIRGVLSEGMLCSLQELGIEEESEGIYVFDESAKVGASVAELIGLDDVALDINVTPNRPDALSVLGIAREVASAVGVPLRKPSVVITESERDINLLAKVEIEDFDGCPRYVARVIEGITIKPSPAWLEVRLRLCGMRPISNIVDVTNYVMLELGQPLHAFDLDVLAEKRIVVRRARQGEKFITLDGQEREMSSADLMICDGSGSVAVAGVMGGLHSEVTASTKNVLLESACFDPGSIRATSKRLGLSTEASYRFERSVDPNLQLKACDRAISLMAQLAGGSVAKGAIDVRRELKAPQPIKLRDWRVKLFLGVELARREVKTLLEPLELDVREVADGLEVTPPSFRPDLKEEADLIEEVARRYGYDKIPSTLPEGRVKPVEISKVDRLSAKIREALTGAGFYEAITLSFMNPKALDWLKLASDDPRRRMVSLLNPLSSQEAGLRTSLLPGLLNAVAYNLNRFIRDPKLFELGKVFLSNGENELPHEPMKLGGAFAATGEKGLYATGAHPFYIVKGAVEELFDILKIGIEWRAERGVPYLLPGESASVLSEGENLGVVGRVKPSVAEKFDIHVPVIIFEIEFEKLLNLSFKDIRFTPLPVYPPAFRDIAVIVAESTQVEDMLRVIREVNPEVVSDVRVFDIYKGTPVPPGRKSVAFSITYRFKDKSPVDEEVNQLHAKIADKLKVAFEAIIR